MRLRVDNTTRFDRNITVGDKVVAMTNPMPSDAPYVTTMHRLDSPHLVQGKVVRVDRTRYVARDVTGRDVGLQTSSATVRNDIIRLGDTIIADTGSASTVHVDSIQLRSADSCYFRTGNFLVCRETPSINHEIRRAGTGREGPRCVCDKTDGEPLGPDDKRWKFLPRIGRPR